MDKLSTLVAAAIKKSRVKHGFQQQDLANVIGVTRTSISNIEHDKQAVSLAMFCKIADALNENPGELLNSVLAQKSNPLVTKDDVDSATIRNLIKKTLAK
jgi:transcriptional regulator with XRE-family HTH domain